MARINKTCTKFALHEWYNALLTNCTTQLRGHTRPYFHKVFWDWRLLANGYADELAYEKEAFDTSLPFAESEKIKNFSLRIREKLPGISPAE